VPIEHLKLLVPNRRDLIYADHARPGIIEDIRRAGFNIKEADKAVKASIDEVKSKPLCITAESVNLIKELRAYNVEDAAHWRDARRAREGQDDTSLCTNSYALQHKTRLHSSLLILQSPVMDLLQHTSQPFPGVANTTASTY
jgi:hypothetical protein